VQRVQFAEVIRLVPELAVQTSVLSDCYEAGVFAEVRLAES